MQYYISWTHSDPVYHEQLGPTPVLVSPPNVNLAWHVGMWSELPPALIIDSGAYQYHREARTVDAADAISRQLQIVADYKLPTLICHLDIPMAGTRDLAELDRRVNRSLENARWLIDYVGAEGLPAHIQLLGVIQGYDVERIYVVAQTLAEMGYTQFALGSLAGMSSSARDELLRRAEAAVEAIGTSLHILGVSSVALLSELSRIGVRSADSSTPMREAWRGGIFYSRPFRRYKLPTAHFHEWIRTYSFAEILTEPLACDCPVCQEDPTRLMQPRGKTFINLRALHNCYHLQRELATAT